MSELASDLKLKTQYIPPRVRFIGTQVTFNTNFRFKIRSLAIVMNSHVFTHATLC